MTNDTSTLNGALSELGETMADNLTSMGVEADAEDGLTTLAGKVLDIEPSVSGIGLITDIDATFSDTVTNKNTNFPCKLTATFDDETLTNVDLAQGVLTGATLLLKEGNNTLTSGITDSNGEATLTTSFATDGTHNLKILFEGTDNFEACEITDSINVTALQVLLDDTTPSAEHLSNYYTYNSSNVSYNSEGYYSLKRGHTITTNTLHTNFDVIRITVSVNSNNTYVNQCKITCPLDDYTQSEIITLTTSKTTYTCYFTVPSSGDFSITLQGGKNNNFETNNNLWRIYDIKIEGIGLSGETIWEEDASINKLSEYNTYNNYDITYISNGDESYYNINGGGGSFVIPYNFNNNNYLFYGIYIKIDKVDNFNDTYGYCSLNDSVVINFDSRDGDYRTEHRHYINTMPNTGTIAIDGEDGMVYVKLYDIKIIGYK